MSPPEERALRLAVERGWLAPAVASELARRCAEGAPLHTLLVPGLVRPEQAAELLRSAGAASARLPAAAAPELATRTAADAPVRVARLPGVPERLGPYRVERELARGGMGVVVAAVHEALGRPVAIKLVLGLEPRALARFQREATATAKLRHPNIVALHEYSVVQGVPYLVMDRIEGGTLAHRLEQADGALPDDESARLAERLADALACAHAHGVIHRDLKPSNVLLDAAGEPLLTDFGLARLREQEGDLTRTGAVMGTAAYMPPEQARGDRDAVDERSDVYGLGAVLYELLTGSPPFGGDGRNPIVAAIADEPERPGQRRPGVDPRLEAICLRCLRKRREDRFQSARALADALGAWRRARAGQGGPPRRRSGPLLAAAAAALISGALVALLPRPAPGAAAPAAPDEPPAAAAAAAPASSLVAEAAHWEALRADPAAGAPLVAIVEGRLAREALMDLEGGWEEVERRLAPPREGPDPLAHDLDALERALGADAPTAERVRGALAAAAGTRASVARALEVAATSSAALLREAARASLLACDLLPPGSAPLADPAAGLAHWARDAAGADGADAAACVLTLMGRAPLLGPGDAAALAPLTRARSPLLRTALALALARAATRRDGREADDLARPLEALGRDEDPAVRGAARRCAAALAVLSGGPPGEALDLALALAREPGARPALRRALLDALARAGAGGAVELELLRARAHLEWGDPAAAAPPAQAALAAAPTSLAAQELARQVALLGGQAPPWPGFAGDHDPLAVRAAEARLAFVARHGLPALPGPDGALRVPVDLTRPCPGVAVWATSAGLRARTRFALDARALELDARAAGARATLGVGPADLDEGGLLLAATAREVVTLERAGDRVARWSVPATGCEAGLTLLRRGRGVVSLDVDGRALDPRALPAAPWFEAGHLLLELAAPAEPRRLLLAGRWDPGAEPPAPPTPAELAAWASRLEALPSATPVERFPDDLAVRSLGDLGGDEGVLLQADGPWPPPAKPEGPGRGQAVWVAGLRGDLELRARVRMLPGAAKLVQAGIGLRGREEALFFGPGGTSKALTLYLQRGDDDPIVVEARGADLEDQVLRVRRSGDLVVLEHGPTPEQLVAFPASPLHLPGLGEVDALVFARQPGEPTRAAAVRLLDVRLAARGRTP